MVHRIEFDNDAFIEYEEYSDGKALLTAHTDEKYGFKMLKSLFVVFKQFDEIITVLPHNYLVTFFSKHFVLELVCEKDKVYKIKEK